MSLNKNTETLSFLAFIAEHCIQEAIKNGLLDDLSMKGQPFQHEDLSGVPEELRMGYKILKNAGYLPEELQLQQEILSIRDMLQVCTDPACSREAWQKLTLRQLQYDMLMEKKGRSLASREYQDKLETRLLRKTKT